MALPSTATWRAVAFNGTVFCTVASSSNKAATSTDGITWTARTLPATADWQAIAWNGTVFCAVAAGGTVAATSPDGITWTPRTLPSSASWSAITWGGGLFCTVAWGSSSAATSPDGITWTPRTLSASANWISVAHDGTVFCAVANGSTTASTSPDGITWTARTLGYSTSWRAIAAGSSGFIVISDGNDAARHSPDNGVTWYARYMPSVASWWSLAWDGSNFTAVAYGSTKAATISPNGMTTTPRTLPSSEQWYGVAWGGGLYCAVSSGTVSAASSDGITWSSALPAITGISTAYTRLDVYPGGSSVAYTTMSITPPQGVSTAHTKLDMVGTGISTAYTALAIIPPGFDTNWSARVTVGGADVSAKVGLIDVDAAEGGARIATVTFLPLSGVIAPLDYVGQSIEIDYLTVSGGASIPRRLFTGVIDKPVFDHSTALLQLICTDDLQNHVAAQSRTVLDSLIGGYFSEAVQGEIDDGWDYAQARLTTVAGSLDADAHNGLRLTPWTDLPVWDTLTSAHLIDGRVRVDLPQRSTISNTVRATFQYRYPRLRQRFTAVGWSGTVSDMTAAGFQYPDQSTLTSAASGTGWVMTYGVFFPAPIKIPYGGGFVYPPAGAIDMAIMKMTQRHSQTVTETFTLTVTAPESVSANGELAHELRGSLASDFGATAWETDYSMAPILTPAAPELNYSPDATRADADYAIDTLLAQAKTKILGSHRSARLSAATPCRPELDLDKYLEIDTGTVSAAGKVASVRHVLDMEQGSAITEFSIAIFGASGAGLITPSPLLPPDPPAEVAATQPWPYQVPSTFTVVAGVTPYNENLQGWLVNPSQTITVHEIPDGEGGYTTQSVPNPSYTTAIYPVSGFRLGMPGVDESDRAPVDTTQASAYQIAIPLDTLTFTIP